MSTPAEKFHWTADRYHRALETGFLAPDERFELIEGELIAVVPVNPPHAQIVGRLDRWLQRAVDETLFVVRVQQPIDIGDHNQPEPDVTIAHGPEGRYGRAHPAPADVVVAIEVADTSARYDRDVKLPLYARYRIQESWLIDVNRRLIEIHLEPTDGGYRNVSAYGDGVITPAHGSAIAVDVAALFSP